MRIEKINENQIRCILSKKDLAERQIKLSELAFGSEKARGLFKDMIDQANDEFGFEANDMPLMIEAMPLSDENIVLQITKVEDPEDMNGQMGSVWADKKEDSETDFVFPEMPNWKEDDFSDQVQLFEFEQLSKIERVAHLLDGLFDGENDLYKNPKTNRFSLLIKRGIATTEEFKSICVILSEYAVRREYTLAKEAFLKEHATLLIGKHALQMLNEI